ncbi:hypothetical protein JG688_00001145, partial [Phytophthora aleatoria]
STAEADRSFYEQGEKLTPEATRRLGDAIEQRTAEGLHGSLCSESSFSHFVDTLHELVLRPKVTSL